MKGLNFSASLNISGDPSTAETHTQNEKAWLELIIPVISGLGVVGNLLNLLVLTRRRLLCTMDRLEKSATFGLVSLAFSDMMFCVAAAPYVFITKLYQSLSHDIHMARCQHGTQSIFCCRISFQSTSSFKLKADYHIHHLYLYKLCFADLAPFFTP